MELSTNQRALVGALTKEIITNPVAMVKAIEMARPENREALFNALVEPIITDAGFVDQNLVRTVAKYASPNSYQANHLLGVIADHRPDLIDHTLLENHIGAIRLKKKRSQPTAPVWSACVMIHKRPDLMDADLTQQFAKNINGSYEPVIGELEKISGNPDPVIDEVIKTIAELIASRPELATNELVTTLAIPALSRKDGDQAILSIMQARPDLKPVLLDEYLKKRYVEHVGPFVHENPEIATPSLIERLVETCQKSAIERSKGFSNYESVAPHVFFTIQSIALIVQVRPELANQTMIPGMVSALRDHAYDLSFPSVRYALSGALDSIGMIAETRSDLMNEELMHGLVSSYTRGEDETKTEILLRVVEKILEKKHPDASDTQWIDGIIKIDENHFRHNSKGLRSLQSEKILDDIARRRPDLNFWILNAS